MKSIFSYLALPLLVAALACTHVQATPGPGTWFKSHRASPTDVTRVLVSLRHKITRQRLEDTCNAVSDPGHAAYGQYLSLEALTNLVAPTPPKLAAVTHWLHNDLTATRVTVAGTRDLVQAQVRVAALEEQLGVDMWVWEWRGTDEDPRHLTSQLVARCLRADTPPTLPARVAVHVEALLGVHELPLSPLKHLRRAQRPVAAASDSVRPSGRSNSPISGAATPARQAPNSMMADATLPAPSIAMPWLYPLDGSPLEMFASQVVLPVSVTCQNGSRSSTVWPKCGKTAAPVTALELEVTNSTGHTAVIRFTNGSVVNNCWMYNAPGTPAQASLWCSQGTVDNWKQYRFRVAAVTSNGTRSDWAYAPVPHTSASCPLENPPASFSGLAMLPQQTPASIQFLYSLPDLTSRSKVNSSSSQCAVEWSDPVGVQNYSPTALDAYRNLFQLPNTSVVVKGSAGNSPSHPGGEADLDMMMLSAVSPGTATTFWNIDMWMGFPIVEWGLEVSSDPSPPLVHSMSYSWNEKQLPVSILSQSDRELLKACTRGITVLAAAGDGGATNSGHNGAGVDCFELQPQFPASSPWVTAVGATLPSSGTARKASGVYGEVAATAGNGAIFTTGGGFASSALNSQTRAHFQQSVVSTFLTSQASTLPSLQFNRSGRAYPDISALGVNVAVTDQHSVWYGSWGTSAATPIVAGMLSLVNSALFDAGRPALGYANPVLYKVAELFPDVFYDVTTGSNNWAQQGYCPSGAGFDATVGWDPVSGLGTVNNFTALVEAVKTVTL